MSIRHRQLPSIAAAVPYYSLPCRIGTHECGEAEPKAPPADVPIVYEACVCACHLRAVAVSGGTGEVEGEERTHG
ncbi:hypothetical protein [Streptomyces corynorhini]|uniref:Uncharacterized protein n=1 Tax=Streptomyces corynorhini TaxID=2282652 RepID=A0A370B3V1_9ACTN|nr:hypothetical protein [Streptomyces corynorhini]RDG36488.1 hypothetical protein DVH02_19745 [Streptomyces corynorhini]